MFQLVGFFAGVVGLLTAFSFITVVEFIYLIGIRRNEEHNADMEKRVWPILVAVRQNNSYN